MLSDHEIVLLKKSILVSGLINIETTLRVDEFPLAYYPVTYPFFGIRSTVSGVGYNLAKALTTLGDEVVFMSLVGKDMNGEQSRAALRQAGIDDRFVISQMEQTAQSVILYDPNGRRQIHVDLKDIQERAYPTDRFTQAAAGCDLLALCNINFSRPLLAQAKILGKPVATDVHALGDLEDAYNRDFMAVADILFLSHESLPSAPEVFARRLFDRYGPQIVVIGLGPDGAFLGVRDGGVLKRFPAVRTRPVVNTIGARDALFSAFLHGYIRTRDPVLSLQKAILFASFKIGAVAAADGFLDEAGLDDLWNNQHQQE